MIAWAKGFLRGFVDGGRRDPQESFADAPSLAVSDPGSIASRVQEIERRHNKYAGQPVTSWEFIADLQLRIEKLEAESGKKDGKGNA